MGYSVSKEVDEMQRLRNKTFGELAKTGELKKVLNDNLRRVTERNANIDKRKAKERKAKSKKRAQQNIYRKMFEDMKKDSST